MNHRLAGLLSGFLVAVMFAAALWALDALPPGARVAVHWGASGQADGWMGKWAGLLFMPVLAIALRHVMLAFPEGCAMPGKLPLAGPAWRALFVGVLLVQAGAQLAVALSAVH